MFSLILGDFICCLLTQPHAKTKAFHHLNVGPSRKKLNYLTQKRDSLELRRLLYFSGLLNMWIEVPEQQLTWWLGSLHPYLATCWLVPVKHYSTGSQLALEPGPSPSGTGSCVPLAPSTLCRDNKGKLLGAQGTVLTSKQRHRLCSQFPPYPEGQRSENLHLPLTLWDWGKKKQSNVLPLFSKHKERRSNVSWEVFSSFLFSPEKGSSKSWVVWKSSYGWWRGGSKGKPCSCGTPQALSVGQPRDLSGPSLFSPANNKNNDTNYSIHFSQVWIKINQTPELLLSWLCILCSPSAKLSYRLNFHSLLQNAPFKVISYSFSFPPQNMETPIRGEGKGSSVSFAAGHVVHSADWVMLCSLPDVCNYAHKGNRPPHNTQAQGPSLYHLPPNNGGVYPLKNSQMQTSSKVQF